MAFEWGNHVETVFESQEHRRVAANLSVPLTVDGVAHVLSRDPHTPSSKRIVRAVLDDLVDAHLVESFKVSSPESALDHVAKGEHLPTIDDEKGEHYVANVQSDRLGRRHYHVDDTLYVLTNQGVEAIQTAGDTR